MHRRGKHSFTTAEAVSCEWSVRRLYNEIPGITKAVFQSISECLCVSERVLGGREPRKVRRVKTLFMCNIWGDFKR
jgi:hypothetical protein